MKHRICYLLVFLSVVSLYPSGLEAQNDNPFEKYYSSLEWRSIGPYRGGRSCAVTGVPGKPNLFYFGATGGGVWKTADGGRSWTNLSDGFFGGSVGSIAVSQSDNNVIYVGGGEKTVRGNVSYGYGVWKTEDAGKSWKSMGLKDSKHIARIRIHPTNHDIVYAAVMGNLFAPSEERGVFKSTDGGKSWKKTLFVNSDAGVVDLCLDPNNPRILYASSWRVRRTPYSLESGGDGSGLWKSTDSGETWTEITKNEGLPKGIWGINAVTVSPVNSDRVWALIENENGGVYRSDDAGKTWKKMNEDRSLRQRAWYYTRIYADTEDESTVYVVNVSYHKSTDGGRSFESSNAPHGDHHDLWIAPEDPKRMIIGDDGGAQVSFDGGENWTTYHNQPTAQFYRVVTDNAFPYRIYAAQQDNSTVRIAHRTNGSSIGEDNWESTAGGESAHIAVDPENPEVVYGGSYGGFLTRVDHHNNTTRAINVYPDNPMGYGAEGMKYRFQWNFPIFFSKHNKKKLYAASNQLHVTSNEGQSWKIVSPDLTRNDPDKLGPSGGPITKDNTGVEYYCTIFAVDESPLQEGLIWAGSDDGLLHVTRDGGESWANVTPPMAPEWLMYNSVEPDPRDTGTCYVAGTLYKAGDFKPYIFKTTDYGKTWKMIVNGIAPDHFTRVVRTDPYKDNILYAGTETAMYISFDDGENWHSFQLNLPIVPITDLTIKDYNLIAATQGRGLWIIDDLSLIHQAAMNSGEESRLFKPLHSYRFGGGRGRSASGEGTNHPSGVMVHYYLNNFDKKDSLSLSFYKGQELITTFSSYAKERDEKIEDIKKGANMFVWNMRYEDAKRFDGMIFWSGSTRGPLAVPGDYRVEMTYNDKRQSQDFKIIGNPALNQSQQNYEKQFNFVQEVNAKVSEAHQAIIDIRELKGQLKKYKEVLKNQVEIVAEITRIDSTINAIENELYQTKNRSNQDPLNFPIKLTNKLAHLNSITQFGDFPPTDQAIEVKNDLIARINEQVYMFNGIKNKDIPALNNLIRSRSVDYIILKKEE